MFFFRLVSGDNKYLLVALVNKVISDNIRGVWSVCDLFSSKVSHVSLLLDERVLSFVST